MTIVAMVILGGGTAFADPLPALAQQARTCTGIIVDDSGEPVTGAGIIVKGTLKGTTTDVGGNFTLPAARVGDVLQISALGFLPSEVVWDGNPLRITLRIDRLSLEESVIVGYGVQKKVNVTGAVSMVESDALTSRPVQTVSQALQGQVPGLNFSVTTGGGELNSNMSFNVRGTGTIGQGSTASPLVLIDGIEGDMNTINPNDVESISVLKDAAASSIYGARGAFGVILITTKSGKAGKTQVSYSSNVSVNSVLRMPQMLPSDKFARYWNRAAANSGSTPVFDAETLQRIDDYIAGRIDKTTIPQENGRDWGSYTLANANTDWFAEFYGRKAPAHQHNLSVSGGNERTSFRVSGSFQNTNGLLRFGRDKLDRYSIDAKVSTKLAEWARLDYATKWTREDYTRPTYLTFAMWGSPRLFMHNIARRWPNVPVYDPNGHLMDGMETAAMRDGGEQTTQRNYYTNQLAFVFEPVKDWRINIEGNMRTFNDRQHYEVLPIYAYYVDETPYAIAFASGGTSPGLSRVNEYRYMQDYFTTNIYSDYSFSIAEAHNFHLLAGFNAELTKYDTITGQGDGLTDLSTPWLSQTTSQPVNSGGREHNAVAGFFARFNYNYMDKYMLELNGRYDGSSRFVGDKRWGFFPSVSAGWNIAKESFFEPLADKISTLKLRASWGSLGNTNTNNWYPFYQTMPVASNSGMWVIDDAKPNTAGMPGIVSSLMTWESIETIDVGLDITAFNGRLSGSFDWFVRRTNNMIGPAPELPGILGATPPRVNNADMKSVGWELELSWRDQIGKDFNYGVRAVLSDATQTITRYPNETNSLSNYYVGRKIGEIWGYESTRLANSQEEMDAWLASNRPSWGRTGAPAI